MTDTYFGKEKTTFTDKTAKVKDLFHRVSSVYDLMNDLMSIGVHRCWKRDFVFSLPLLKNNKILDVAGGTGDISISMAKNFAHLDLDITVLDLSHSMILEGRNKAWDQGILSTIHWHCGNAEQLPYPDHTFNGYTISFGLRNVADIPKALQEAKRVLKPGGFFACLEFSHIQNFGVFQKAYNVYSDVFIPWLGEKVSGDKPAYEYLKDSIRNFPNQTALSEMITAAGFNKVTYKNYLQGVAAYHSATA